MAQFKTLEGKKVLFRALALNAAQMTLVGEIIAHYDGRTLLTRKELRDAHGILRPGRRAAPYFISKNVACKTKEHGKYELKNLKLSAAAAKPAPAETDAPKPKSKSNKKVQKKKGAETPAESSTELATV